MLVDAKLSETSVRVPICNPTIEEAELKANQMLARSVAVIPSSMITYLSVYRDLTFDDVMCPKTLTAGEQEELLYVLNNRRRCFALSLNELVCTAIGEMDIVLKKGSQLFAAKLYRTSRVKRDKIARPARIQNGMDHSNLLES